MQTIEVDKIKGSRFIVTVGPKRKYRQRISSKISCQGSKRHIQMQIITAGHGDWQSIENAQVMTENLLGVQESQFYSA